jgi:hypothetical protein
VWRQKNRRKESKRKKEERGKEMLVLKMVHVSLFNAAKLGELSQYSE